MLVFSLLLVSAAPSVTDIPAPVGLEAKLVGDARDGRLDTMPLLEAALVASGVADADVPAEAARVRAALAPAIARARTQQSAHARGKTLLKALHETTLRMYAATASEIDDVARTGEYNCLSSALLYVVAADGLVQQPRAMVTKYHAYARVNADGRDVDVETTSANGFDADRAKLMTPEFVKKIAGPGTSAAELLDDLKRPEELPVLSLVAGVYANRAVGLVGRGDLGGAAVALDRAARLATGQLRSRAADWRGSVLNNGALELAEQGRYEDARALLTLALEGMGAGGAEQRSEGETRRLLLSNLAVIHLHIADKALERRDWTGALAAVAGAERYGASAKDLATLRSRANAELASLEGNDKRCATSTATEAAQCFAGLARALREKDPDAALQHARRAHQLAPADDGAVRALFFTLAGKARVEGESGRCDAVETLIREAQPYTAKALEGGQRWVPDEIMAACWARLGDAAFDKQSWDVAGRHYARARAHLPEDKTLRANVAAVDVNRAIALAKEGKCDEARPLAKRAAQLEPASQAKATQLLESCAAVRAKRAADKGEWAAAAAELRRGLSDAPASAALRENLGTMLHNLAGQLLRERSCEEARALVPELEALGKSEAREAVRKQCP